MPRVQSTAKSARVRRILADRLPEEILLPVAWRRALTTVFLTALFMVAINLGAKIYLTRYPVNRGYWLIHAKWKLLDSMAGPTDWLILGDSSANQGLIPAVIEERLGGQAINLATTAGTTLLDDLWMLEEHIQRFGPPENVLVTHTVDVWRRDVATVMIAKIPRPWGFWRSSSASVSLDSDIWLNVFLARYVPLYGENGSILTAVMRALDSPEKLFQNPFQLGPAGYMPSERPDLQVTPKDAEIMVDLMERDGFSISPINRDLLDRLVLLADQHDFDLYLVNGPLYEEILQDEASRKYLDDMSRALAETAGRSDNVHYVSLLAGFPLDQMVSADHVIHEAAQLYSQMLASEIDEIRTGAGSAAQP